MSSPSWERRHTGRREFWGFEFFTANASVGGFVGLTFLPDRRRCWYWAALVGERRPYLLVRDLEVALPRLPASREVRSEALWADMNCETPLVHWSLGLEAFGVAMDDPGEALETERGERVGLGLDLEWESTGGIVGVEGAYDQPGVVHGEILVGGGGVETIAFEGHGWRRHAWSRGDGTDASWVSSPGTWLRGRLDDGTPHRSELVGDGVAVEPLYRAPLAVEVDGRPVTLERRLCRFGHPLAGRGMGWVERLEA